MTTIGFTGARETNARQAAFIRAPVAKLEADALVAKLEADAYVSGACTGVDEVVARAVAEMQPVARNVIVVPTNRSCITPGFVEEMAALGAEILEMPSGTSYRDRNQRIVDLSDGMVGVPPFACGMPSSSPNGAAARLARSACRALRRRP